MYCHGSDISNGHVGLAILFTRTLVSQHDTLLVKKLESKVQSGNSHMRSYSHQETLNANHSGHGAELFLETKFRMSLARLTTRSQLDKSLGYNACFLGVYSLGS
eukprot:5525116-Amphidinium_carterae.1